MCEVSVWKTWQRPTLPRLETEYHRRRGFSRPSSGWDRVLAPRYSHQAVRGSEDGGCRRTDAGCREVSFRHPASDIRHPTSVFTRSIRACHCKRSGFSICLLTSVIRHPVTTKRLIERLVPVSAGIAPFAPPAYRRGGLPRLLARPGFEGGFPLRCFQRLSRPHIATRRCGWRHNRYTRGASIPVLSY